MMKLDDKTADSTPPSSRSTVIHAGMQPPHARPMLDELVDQDDHEPKQRPDPHVLHDLHELVRGAIESQVDGHLQTAGRLLGVA